MKKIQKAGIQVIGISFDDVAVLKRFADARKITFPLLSDKGSKIIKAYGIHYRRGLPKPGTFVIDKTGVIRDKLFLNGYRKRHKTEDLLKAAAKLKAEK